MMLLGDNGIFFLLTMVYFATISTVLTLRMYDVIANISFTFLLAVQIRFVFVTKICTLLRKDSVFLHIFENNYLGRMF